jgi:hypothetical protein
LKERAGPFPSLAEKRPDAMALYFFDVTKNDENFPDPVGQEFPDEAHAHREAVKALAEMGAEEIPQDGNLILSITVSDDARNYLFCTRLSFEHMTKD